MTITELNEFKAQLANFSVEELEKEAEKLKSELSKMILNSDIIAKASIVDQLLQEKKESK